MSLENRIKEALLAVGSDYKTVRTWLFGSSVGTLAGLTTTDKSSVIAAINEVKNQVPAAPADASTNTAGVVQLASLADVAAGVDGNKAVTAAGVRQERSALKAEILGGVGPAFDTLLELSQQDAVDQTALLNAIGLKANSADVYTKAEIGNAETDFAAYYAAAKA